MRRISVAQARPAVAGLALAALAAACTGDGGDGDAAPAETSAATTALGGEPTADTAGGAAGDGTGSSDGGGATGRDDEGEPDGEVRFEDIPELVEDVIGSVLAVQTSAGEGSGVVFDDEGIAVTNAHVVAGSTAVRVVTAAGEVIDAEVVGTDPFTDLAVLRLAESDLPPLEFAEELPRVGSLAVAIGNPLGFENTVSAGVVSGLERSVPGGGPALVGLIQTDAAISPGNSGGALIGSQGTVIGINVAYIPPSAGGAVAIGFAIPAPVVIDVVEQLLDGDEVEHPFVGIQPAAVTPEAARRLGLDEPVGVLVLSVVPGGPAAEAGILPGDVLLGLGDERFADVTDFLRALRDHDPGEVVQAQVLRDGRQLAVDITLGQRPPLGG